MDPLVKQAKAINNRKAYLMAQLTSTFDEAKKSSLSQVDAEVYLRSCSKYEDSFEKLVEEIFTINESLDKKEQVSTSDLGTFRTLIDAIVKHCVRIQLIAKTSAAAISAAAASNVQPSQGQPTLFNGNLPKLLVPVFDGDIVNWAEFKAQFTQIIHNRPGLGNALKLTYLRNSLKGEPLSIIKQYSISDESYEQAWDDLLKRYDSKRRAAAHHLFQILHFKAQGHGRDKEHIKFCETHRAASAALKALEVEDLSDFLLFELSYQNLSIKDQEIFDRDHINTEIPTMKDLLDFVEGIARSEELRLDKANSSGIKSKEPNPSKERNVRGSYKNAATSVPIKKAMFANARSQSCFSCKGDHPLYRCPELDALSVPRRKEKVKELGCCSSCLYKHTGKPCTSKYACKICGSKSHNSILHDESSPPQPSTSSQATEAEVKTCHCATAASVSQVLLGTMQCQVKDNWGELVRVRAILDPGSEISIITTSLAQRLSLPKVPANYEVQGIGQSVSRPLGSVNIELSSIKSSSACQLLEAVVLPRICGQLPSTEVSDEVRQRFQNLELADPDFHKTGNVQILLGADVYADLLSAQEPSIISGTPSAIRTKFGYVIIGRVNQPSTNQKGPAVSLRITTAPLDTALTRFWESEEVSQESYSDPDDVACENHFRENHSREENGRFVVRLPFLPDATPMGSNEHVAMKCLYRLEKRLDNNPLLNKQYNECLLEYITLGHMSASTNKVSYLLPHHAVFKEGSSTTKVRVVFDCSSKDNTGLSLNDRLYRGPPLLSDISALMINFRLFPVCLVSDIKMMYRMVSVHPEDRRHLVVAWRSQDHPDQYQQYQMNRLTFGMKPAGFLAGRCIIELANLHKNEYPVAASAIYHNRYADDFCTGADDIESAKLLQRQMTNLLAKGGFEIRRWSSNCPEALEDVPEDFREIPVKLPTGEVGVKVLGIMWEQVSDSFVVRVVGFEASTITKRSILSYVAKIYDVMGLFSPTVFLAKFFMQRLCLAKLDWDQPLHVNLADEWLTYANDLKSLSEIKIARYLPVLGTTVRLVGFSDASEKGMAAVCYLQLTTADGECSGHVLKAKSKLAPLKTLTIPRLELCAALLLAKLIKSVQDTCQVAFESVDLYTDSKIVLAWLDQPLHELKIFVANRVSQIQQLVPNATWGHVTGVENPSDLGSRGLSASQLKNAAIWWQGPSFLELPRDQWPGRPSETLNRDEIPEIKINLNVTKREATDQILNRFSSLAAMQRTLAFVLRFIKNLKNPTQRVSGPLSAEELESALLTAVRLNQEEDFADEIKKLRCKKPIDKQLQGLSPFIDEGSGLLRVGGRLGRSTTLSYSAKHPLLLKKQSHLSALICDSYHKRLLHVGPRTTAANIQTKFWIMSIRSLLKGLIHRCITCHRLNAKPNQPIMADVLPERMQKTYPWASCALDFGGPFTTKESNLRKSTTHKSYFCVFVCLTTRAIHIEMVTDLTAAAFLAAFQRFTARRSVPEVIYSDRGTNFAAARTTLRECRDFLVENHDTLFSAAAAVGTRWILNAPYAPNFNGCAENGVKSCKALMKRQVGLQVLTFEEFNTLLCRIEQVLNSRPIAFSNDINDQDQTYITPGHFITGRSMMTPPEEPVEENVPVSSRWRRVQQASQGFWKAWSTAYLHELMQRKKWIKNTINIKAGDLVYITGIGTSPLSWPIGRVEETFCNPSDSTVRVARVRSHGRQLIRPVNKLVIIPTDA